MKYSIITPSFNQAHFIERTINSVLENGYSNLEYIIIDGGSTDYSVEIIKKYSKQISYWVSEPDNGQSNAFNKGLSVATGDIIGWLNSDDIYLKNAIQLSAEIFNQKPEIDIIFADYYFIDDNDNILKRRREPPFDYNTYLWTRDCYHANCAAFFRKKCFDICGNMREDLHYSMDYELYLRFYNNGLKFHKVNDYWGAYRLHSESKSVNYYNLMLQEGQKIFHQYLDPDKNRYISIKKLYYKYLRITRKLLGGLYFR